MGKLRDPNATFHAVRLRVDIFCLMLRNRLGRSPVATGGPGVVVSMTTYGKRVRTVHLAIESIARGAVRPARLILWLDEPELVASLPNALTRLRKRGLEVKLCKNYGPHKKYYPYVESQEVFSGPLVTADDDAIYPQSWLGGLLGALEKFPDCVNCYRARVMTLRDRAMAPYREWPLCESTDPGLNTVATGVSGVIYPTSLLRELKNAGTGFEAICPKADDLWLHVCAIRAGYRIRQIHREAIHFPMIPGTQETSLYAENCAQEDGNDRQSAVTYRGSDLDLIRGSSCGSEA